MDTTEDIELNTTEELNNFNINDSKVNFCNKFL